MLLILCCKLNVNDNDNKEVKMKKLLSAIITIFFICSHSFASEKVVNVVGAEFPPYSGEYLDENGLVPLLMKKALELSGYKVVFEMRPFARALHETRLGKAHAVAPIYKTKEREEYLAFSESFDDSRTVLIKLKSLNVSYNKLEDLKPYRIGLIFNTSTTPELDSADFLEKDTVYTYAQNIRKLLNKRVDLVVGNERVILYHLDRFFTEDEYKQIEIMEPALQIQSNHVGFSKQVPNYLKLMEDFNQGIRRMKSDGTYDEILNKYK